MPSQLIHIYGPFSIQIFGVMVMLGLLWFVYQLCKDKPLALYLAHEDIFNLATWAIGAGILGARVLYIVTNQHEFTSWHSMLFIWQGGFSILGAIAGVLACLVIYLYIRNIPILYVTDRCALYAPLLQAIARIGCFYAGCCYGSVTQVPWKILIKQDNVLMYVHPSQLYSALLLALLYILLNYYYQYTVLYQGQLTSMYIIGAGIERATVDMFRADKIPLYLGTFTHPSTQQVLAMIMVILGVVLYGYSMYCKRLLTFPENRM